MNMPWRPLLEATNLALPAREAADAIARDLERLDPETLSPDLNSAGGTTLFFAYHAAAFEDPASDRAADRWLDVVSTSVATKPLRTGLYPGFTGIGWITNHLAGGDGDDDPNVEIDRALEVALTRDTTGLEFDLVSGIVGTAVYSFARLPRPTAITCIERVIDHLERTARTLPEGISWFTDPSWLSPDNRSRTPNGYYSFGVAHGVPAAIAVLARAVEHGIAVERARPLLDGAVAWILAHRTNDLDRSQIPTWVAPNETPVSARSAWCYGDPGVAIVLVAAGRAAGMPSWSDVGHDLLRQLARRPREACRVVDAGLCHGAFGLAHLLARGHAATDDPELRAAAITWYERGLAMREPGKYIGGFFAHRMHEDRSFGPATDHAFLGGSAGIGLALVAALSPAEPAWDRLLLADIP